MESDWTKWLHSAPISSFIDELMREPFFYHFLEMESWANRFKSVFPSLLLQQGDNNNDNNSSHLIQLSWRLKKEEHAHVLVPSLIQGCTE